MTPEIIFLIDIAGRSAFVILVAWALILALPKLAASGRYWIWFSALCALPLLLLTTNFPAKALVEMSSQSRVEEISVPTPTVTTTPSNEVLVEPVPVDETELAEPVLTVSEAPDLVQMAAPEIEPGKPSISVLLIVYALGFFTCTGRLLFSLLRLKRLRRGASTVELGLEVPESTRVLTSSDISVPLTWGTLRPVIALPKTASDWSHERLQVVIAHESAHIERRDFATGLIASIVRSIFWFQPLVWLVLRRMWIEREIACDDRVVQLEAAAPADYAEHLSEIVTGTDRRALGAAISMGRPSEIVGRVRAILDSARNRGALSSEMKRRISLLALVLFMPLAFVRCAGEKPETTDLKTGNGIQLAEIDPSAISLTTGDKTVEIPASGKFSMAVREVTQAEFTDLLGHNPSSTQAAQLPVDRVTRTEAATFCKVLTERDRASGVLPKDKVYRLPTQREWLLAAFPGGLVAEKEALSTIAWHQGNSAGLIHPVGAKEANAYGLYDMIGNAAEWTDPDPELDKASPGGETGQFEASVLMQIHAPESGVFATGQPDQDKPAALRTAYVQTQFQLVKSMQVLRRVVLELNLAELWSLEEQQATAKLAAAVRVNEVRGTDLVSLTCSASSGDEAVKLAEGVAQSYRDWIEEHTRERSKRILSELKMETSAQEALMEKSQTVMLRLMQDAGLVDISIGTSPERTGSGLQTGSGTLVQRSKLDEYTAKTELDKLRTEIGTLMDLDGDAMIKSAVALGINNPTLINRYPEYETAKLDLDSLLASGVEKDDLRVRTAQQKTDLLKKMLVDAVETSRRTLGTQLQIAEKNLENVMEAKKSLEQDSLDEKRRSVEYLAAKDEYELHKTLLSEMKHRIAISAVNERMPRQLATIHERAVARKVSTKGRTGTPSAIGGTAFDDPETITDWTRSIGAGEERTPGVGFRFVLVDE